MRYGHARLRRNRHHANWPDGAHVAVRFVSTEGGETASSTAMRRQAFTNPGNPGAAQWQAACDGTWVGCTNAARAGTAAAGCSATSTCLSRRFYGITPPLCLTRAYRTAARHAASHGWGDRQPRCKWVEAQRTCRPKKSMTRSRRRPPAHAGHGVCARP